MTQAPQLSDAMFAYHAAECEFRDAMFAAGFGDYERIGGDDYDNSIVFHGVARDARMGEAAQRIVYDAGFSTAYLNHKDGWATHYSWKRGEPFKPSRGWRGRWVADPAATTARNFGQKPTPENAGYYEISYWPEGWTQVETREWLSSGYMRIVPDPLEATGAPPVHER
jgi:hypothetical protein